MKTRRDKGTSLATLIDQAILHSSAVGTIAVRIKEDYSKDASKKCQSWLVADHTFGACYMNWTCNQHKPCQECPTWGGTRPCSKQLWILNNDPLIADESSTEPKVGEWYEVHVEATTSEKRFPSPHFVGQLKLLSVPKKVNHQHKRAVTTAVLLLVSKTGHLFYLSKRNSNFWLQRLWSTKDDLVKRFKLDKDDVKLWRTAELEVALNCIDGKNTSTSMQVLFEDKYRKLQTYMTKHSAFRALRDSIVQELALRRYSNERDLEASILDMVKGKIDLAVGDNPQLTYSWNEDRFNEHKELDALLIKRALETIAVEAYEEYTPIAHQVKAMINKGSSNPLLPVFVNTGNNWRTVVLVGSLEAAFDQSNSPCGLDNEVSEMHARLLQQWANVKRTAAKTSIHERFQFKAKLNSDMHQFDGVGLAHLESKIAHKTLRYTLGACDDTIGTWVDFLKLYGEGKSNTTEFSSLLQQIEHIGH